MDFDAKVFRLFNKGWPPNRVIAKYGHADRVIKLWEEYRQIMQDDYCRALEKLGEYGFQADLDSKYPLSDQVDQLGGEHWTFTEERKRIWSMVKGTGLTEGLEEDVYESAYDGVKRLVEGFDIVVERVAKAQIALESLKQEDSRKDEQIASLEKENADLSRLRKYEALSDEQIQQREATRQRLDWEVKGLENTRQSLSGEVNALKSIASDLNVETGAGVMRYMAGRNFRDIWKMYTEANYSKEAIMAKNS